MNEDLLYTLDPYIISVLFKSKDDEKTLEIYTDMVEAVGFVFKETIKEFLLENKFSEEDVQKVLDTENLENVEPRFKPYLQNIILFDRIQANSRQLIKLYYDQLLPNLNQQEKDDLATYLKDSEELIKVKKEGVLEGLKELKNILDENGVKSYQELVAKSENINLNETQNTVTNEGTPAAQPVENATPAITVEPSAIAKEPVVAESPAQTPEPVKSEAPVIDMPQATTSPSQPVENPMDTINPVKATILDDEPSEPVKPIDDQVVETPPAQVSAPALQNPTSAVSESAQSRNLISQLVDMGIDLDDNKNQPA